MRKQPGATAPLKSGPNPPGGATSLAGGPKAWLALNCTVSGAPAAPDVKKAINGRPCKFGGVEPIVAVSELVYVEVFRPLQPR